MEKIVFEADLQKREGWYRCSVCGTMTYAKITLSFFPMDLQLDKKGGCQHVLVTLDKNNFRITERTLNGKNGQEKEQ